VSAQQVRGVWLALVCVGCGGGTQTPAGVSAGGDAAASADAAGGGGHAPDPRFLPRASGPCPTFADGTITVHPAGGARDVRIWMSPAARSLHGPLIFYWHGTGNDPGQAELALGSDGIAAIEGLGGIVAAPFHDPAAGTWPWYLVAGTQELDLQVADEVLACAIADVGIDLRRIHSVGFSAGALHTAQMSYRRSGYLASVVTYSGGQSMPIPDQDPDNRFAAMIFHGGANDRVLVGFQQLSEMYRDDLRASGRFGFLCNHMSGHKIPTDATAAVGRFLADHPFDTSPSPYAGGLPPGFPPYCQL